MFSIRVLFFLLLSLAGGSLDPGPEAQMLPPGIQEKPALARAFGVTVAVWTDGRVPDEARLFWALLPETAPDSLGTRVSGSSVPELQPSLAAGADWALAAWESWGALGVHIAAAELPVSGLPGPVPVVPISPPGLQVRRPAAAIRDGVAVVVWEDDRIAPGEIYLARWDRGLGLRDPGGAPLAAGAGVRFHPRIAAGDSGFVAVWSETPPAGERRIGIQRLDSLGEPQGPPGFMIVPSVTDLAPAIAASESGFIVVWQRDGASGDLDGRFLDPAGTPLGTGPIALVVSPGFDHSPKMSATDAGVCLVWSESSSGGRGLRRAWVDALGGLHPAGGLALTPLTSFAADPAVATEGGWVRAAWREPTPGDDDDLYTATFLVGDTVDVPVAVPLTVIPLTPLTAPEGVPVPGPLAAYPNPGNGGLRIEAAVPEGSNLLDIFDVRGRVAATLSSGDGRLWEWNGRLENGASAPPGVYIARRRGARIAVRMVLLP